MKFRRLGWLISVSLLLFLFRKWIKTPQLNTTNYKPIHEQNVLPIRRLWQRAAGVHHPNSACGPTTGAMIVQYMMQQQNAEINTTDAVVSVQLINTLYKEIGTRPWGTSARRWQKGMMRYFSKTCPEENLTVHLQRASGQYGTYCQSIDKGMPVVLRFTFNSSPQTFASHHYILGIGYSQKGDEEKVAVLDADGGKLNNKIHWINWNDNERFIKILSINEEK